MALGLAACGSSNPPTGVGGAAASTTAKTGAGNVTFPVFFPFSGHDADYGGFAYPGCPPAVNGINQAGGILGHKATCQVVDTRGDPADAVSAADQLLATTSNIGGIVGPSSDEDTATAPIFEKAHVVTMDEGGTQLFDHQTNPYYWRSTPPDILDGVALAVWAKRQGYTNVALVFGNDNAAQGNVPGVVKAAKVLGIHLTTTISLTNDQTSYETEVQQVIGTHPQAIFTETDAQTGGVFFNELKAAGVVIPTLGTAGIGVPDYNTALIHAVGAADYAKYWVIVQPFGAVSGPTFTTWNHLMMTSGQKHPGQSARQVYSELPYDDINIMALAMVAAHSIQSSAYRNYMQAVTAAKPGAVVVHSFAAGKSALHSGKQIQYVGPTGAVDFNKYQNSPGMFSASLPGQNYKIVGIITAPQVNHVAIAGGV
ncbi:MAG: ABC transporter substrate-binding protein [Solirubrobacteraceae bacterium]